MGYKVDFDALDTMYSEIDQQVSKWTTELRNVAKSMNDLISSEKLTGKGADNIKSYFQTVHLAIMQSMMTLLQSHSAYCLMYKSDYQSNIDSSLHAVIHSEELFRIMTKLRVQHTNTTEVDLHIRRALSNVSHLVNTNLTSSGMMEEMYSAIGRDLVNLDSDIVQLENTHLNNDFEETQELIKSLTDFINEYLSTDKAAKTEYTPSQMASSKKYDRLYKAIENLNKKNDSETITMSYQQACDHEQERLSLLEDEAAKKREEEGIINAVAAAGAIIIGVAAIVATWGAATPLVATAWVAGGSAVAYGVSNGIEAGQDIYYGSIGDPYTVAFNPIRDTVFCGNQGLYDLWGGVATDVAGMLIPIGIASKAAKAAEIGTKAAKSASIASKLTKPKVIQTVASGVHGAVSAGVGNVKQQFYEKGSLEAIDWGEVAGKSTVSGIVGAGTGAVGAGISSKATSWLSNRAITSSLLNSESAVTRVAANFAVGSVSEVGAGVGTRFVGGILTNGGNIKEAAAQAINPQSILFDAALGGAMSGVQGLKKPQQSYADLMSPEDAAKYRQFLEHGSTSGFTSPELKAFDKVDEALLMKSIDYDKVLTARKSAITNTDGTISGVQGLKKPQQNSVISNSDGTISGVQEINKPRQYSGDLMSPEDAARYSEHWRQLGIGSDETWSAFKEHYPNGTIDDYLAIVKDESPWPPGYTPEEIVLEPGDSFEMALSKNQSPNTPGRFATTSGSITDKKYVRTDLAVKEKWKSDIDKVVGYQIKDGKRISALSGPVGPQIDLESNTFLAGGADQIHIPLDRDVNMMDYLEIKDIRNIR